MTTKQARIVYDLALKALVDDSDVPLKEDVQALNALAKHFGIRRRQIGTDGLPTLER